MPSSFFGRGTSAVGPDTVSMDGVLTKALCDNRKELAAIRSELGQIKDILVGVHDLLAANLEQSRTVSQELQDAARQLGERGRSLADALQPGRP